MHAIPWVRVAVSCLGGFELAIPPHQIYQGDCFTGRMPHATERRRQLRVGVSSWRAGTAVEHFCVDCHRAMEEYRARDPEQWASPRSQSPCLNPKHLRRARIVKEVVPHESCTDRVYVLQFVCTGLGLQFLARDCVLSHQSYPRT